MRNLPAFYKKILVIIMLFVFNVSFAQQIHQRPNFVVILTDDQTYRAIGYNNNLVHTPNLDQLAAQGIIFDRAFVSTPICAASRASMLTGLYPQTNGTIALNTNAFIKTVVEEQKYKTMAHYLNEAGYATYFSGKSHLGDPLKYGFQFGEESKDFKDSTAFRNISAFIKNPAFANHPFLIWLAPKQPHVPLKPDQKWLNLYAGVKLPVEANFLEKPANRSFFNQGLPGENYYRDSEYTDNYRNLPAGPPRTQQDVEEFTKAYYATISHLDEQVGEFIKLLKNSGNLNNTVIIFLSDNGYFLGNHGLGNKITMYEESVHIPFFIYWDKIKNKGTHYKEVISNVDVLPTVLELAGIKPPGLLQGRSFKNVVEHGSTAKIQDYVVSECVGVGGSFGEGHRMVRSKHWKYILSDTKEEALFDMLHDPYELHNLFHLKNKPVVEGLKAHLQKWKALVGDRP